MRKSITSYTQALGISETALRVACREVAGASPGRILDERAILEARRCLSYSNISVAEIAYSLGFTDPAYFSRFFQHNVGLSPKAYRAKAANGETSVVMTR